MESVKFASFEENLSHVNEWHTMLNGILDQNRTGKELSEEKKPFLFYVNPKAGAGKATTIYHERIVPILAEANIPNTLVLTSKLYYKT